MSTPLQEQKPLEGALYRHQDGGIYRFLMAASSSVDQSELYIYEHLWPFETGKVWARPVTEWASRFTPINGIDLGNARLINKAAAQEAVIKAKRLRRANSGAQS